MRIISGRLGGRKFNSPNGHRTHPMSDKGRGALFNALGDIEGLTVLDAFAGSGALSFEAISRGAALATAIDRDRNAQVAIKENASSLGISKELKIIKTGASSWLSTSEEMYDLVFLDPPFSDLQLELMKRLSERAKPGGLIVFSLPPGADIELDDRYERLRIKEYGDNKLVFYRRND